MSHSLCYRIFCKWCRRPFEDDLNCYELEKQDMLYNAGLYLNCHVCNNYAIIVSSDHNDIRESFRDGKKGVYFRDIPKKTLDTKPKFGFEWGRMR